MDVAGTASAVLGILQVGFSLAKAIRETVKDYKDAADDLISLAQEIESTLYLVSQLDRLVVDNKKTGTFNNGGLAELNRCLKNTEQIVEALVELLTRLVYPIHQVRRSNRKTSSYPGHTAGSGWDRNLASRTNRRN